MARTKTLFRLTAGLAVPLAALLFATPVLAATAPSLGAAASFAALGGAGVTCTSPNAALPAPTVSGGDVGSGSVVRASVTGFPAQGFPGALPCTLSGNVLLGATPAMGAFNTAYSALVATPCDPAHLLSGELGGQTLFPGVYCISATGLLTKKLTLSGGPNDTWIFKATSITPIGGSVVMFGGNACNVYWQVGAASFVDTAFAGNVLSGSAITFEGTHSSLIGRALAKTKVTLTGAHIAACTASGGGGGGGGGDDDDNGNGGGDDHHGDGDKDDHHGDGDKDDHHAHHGEGRSHDDD